MPDVPVAGVLLTGGSSRRMGRDKATIVSRGETLAVRAGRVLAAACDPVVEVGPGASGLPSVREDPPGSGPLAALLAGADALGVAGPVIVLAVDMPFVDEPLVRLIADRPGAHSVVPVVRGRPQYACARWSVAALSAARRSHEVALRSLAGEDTEYLDESVWTGVAPEHALFDADTPDDLASLEP